MNRWFTNLHQKSELNAALVLIAVYCAVQTAAINLSTVLGVDSAANFVFNLILSAVLLVWIRQNGHSVRYGLCKTDLPASAFLLYLPLGLLISQNLWAGAARNLPALDTVCYIGSMCCVGFLEEVIFRGFLFRALETESRTAAMVISSVTFGLGHLLNLINGSGMSLLDNLCQVVGAVAIGFLFVLIFDRGGSLYPCILTHSAINALSVFANESALTPTRQLLFSALNVVIAVVYTLILLRTLPKSSREHE